MVSVVISIGSNCGDRKKSVSEALNWLKSILMQTECSEIYETPCARSLGTPYMNAVIKGFYSGDGIDLEDLLKDKELQMGRTSQCREKGEVPIDMDIVLMNNEIIKTWDYRQRFFQYGFKQLP